jgi:hypothetical protein
VLIFALIEDELPNLSPLYDTLTVSLDSQRPPAKFANMAVILVDIEWEGINF